MQEIVFSQIHPFVRYVGDRTIDEKRTNRWMVSRDNRLFLCKNGEGHVQVDQKSFKVSEGTLLFIPVGMPYLFPPAANGPLIFLSLNFDFLHQPELGPYQLATLTPQAAAEQQLVRFHFTDTPLFNEPVICQCDEYMTELLHQVHKEYFYNKLYAQQIVSANLTLALVRALRKLSAEKLTKVNRAGTIDKLIDYIQHHYAEKLTLESIAKHMGYHPDYINRLMHYHTGQTIYQFLQDFRINKAIRMIRSSELSFSAIAEKTGFINVSHFSHTLKKKTGKTPSEFRAD